MEDVKQYKNMVQCLICQKLIESTHRHHFIGCNCPEETRVYVDGGNDYWRLVAGPKASYMRIWEPLVRNKK